jgi:hypothetical protein
MDRVRLPMKKIFQFVSIFDMLEPDTASDPTSPVENLFIGVHRDKMSDKSMAFFRVTTVICVFSILFINTRREERRKKNATLLFCVELDQFLQ